jgi:hypothetical protein
MYFLQFNKYYYYIIFEANIKIRHQKKEMLKINFKTIIIYLLHELI